MNREELVRKMREGDRLALSRLISIVENRRVGTPEIMSAVHDRCGRAHVLGVTGPPGAGKSTLLNQLVHRYRENGNTVGVVAVDPSSPFSGGALLGDRIRMQRHFNDEGVFIRSLSARGAVGGLARAARDVGQLLDAFGKDVVIVETVGVGQSEFDIVRLAPTVVVVLTPQAGDTVQAMKAGLLEVADVFVVNKADLPGAEQVRTELEQMLQMQPQKGWKVPVVLTSAEKGSGVGDLVETLERHHAFLAESGEGAARAVAGRLEDFSTNLCDELRLRIERHLDDGRFRGIRERLEGGGLDPYGAVGEVLADRALLLELLEAGG